jgi:hypothetical protein
VTLLIAVVEHYWLVLVLAAGFGFIVWAVGEAAEG